ncbi:hypothetical protein BN903_261 [Halorubrum sp. AJ67]|nr:hypothetical protein BN903_261 [Halorubrum sp. AJ67]
MMSVIASRQDGRVLNGLDDRKIGVDRQSRAIRTASERSHDCGDVNTP